MKKIGLKALKNQLSAYIRLAASGERVVVTDRERVVAEIVPPRATAKAATPEARWAALVRLGIVRPATRRLAAMPRRFPIMERDELMKELDADRAER